MGGSPARRPILIGADIGRAVLLGSIPVAAALGRLNMEYLYIASFTVGVFTVFFDVSYLAYLPSLINREQLVEGNSKLEVSWSVAQVLGPSLAGGIVELVAAPMALALDALSFLLSALMFALIRTPEAIGVSYTQRRNIWREIGEGLWLVLGDPLLRPIVSCASTSRFFISLIDSVYLLYVTRELDIQPTVLGLILALGLSGTLLGALLAGRIARRLGLGSTLVVSALLWGLGYLLIPLASGSLVVTAPLLVAAGFVSGLGGIVYDINQLSFRQASVANHLQGRLNASMRFLIWGTMPIGAVLGGVLGETIGLRATLMAGAFGALSSFLWVFFSPVRVLREQR